MTSYFILMLENISISQKFGKCDYYDLILHISYSILQTVLEYVNGVKIVKNTIFMTSYFILMLGNVNKSQNHEKRDFHDLIFYTSYFILMLGDVK